MSSREDAVKALVTALETTGAEVWRATDLPEVVPPEGLIEVTEGEDQLEVMLSPLAYAHDLAVTVTCHTQAVDEAAREERLDNLLLSASSALTDDLTLGGAVEVLMIGAPTMDAWEGEGAGRSASFPVSLVFTTVGSPLA
jgi:hypothetical protein